MTTSPAVTVLMAVYNGERFLEEALRSVLRQSWESFEFLVVDDGSTDGTASIIAGLRDRRIRVLRNETNLGLTTSLNRGLAEARGEFVARLDADDVSEPARLEEQVRFLRANPSIALVGTGCRIIDDEGRVHGIRRHAVSHEVLRWNLLFFCPFWHSTVMWRRKVVDDLVGAYDASFGYAMDYDLWVRVAEVVPVANLRAPLVRYRVGPHAMTATHPARDSEILRARFAAAHSLFPAGSKERELWDREASRILQIIDGWHRDAGPEEMRWLTSTIWNFCESYCAREAAAPHLTGAVREWTRHWLSRQLLKGAIAAHSSGNSPLRDAAFRAAIRLRPASAASFLAARYARARLGIA